MPVNLSGKRIALLGGTLISCEIVKAAHSLGVDMHVLDYNPPEKSPAKRLVKHHAQISVTDVDAVVAYLEENKIDGVITGYSDMLLPFYADICKKANLPCYGTRELFETFTNKSKWKELCRQFDIPTARRYQCANGALDDDIAYPVFVKPADGSGSRGVGVAAGKEELRSLIARARAASKNGEVIIEQYLQGPELTIFWLFVNGRYYVSQIGNRLVKSFEKGVLPLPVGYTFPASYTESYLGSIAPRVRNMLESQHVENGMMFMQCIMHDDRAFVYDIGYRLTGSLEHYLTQKTAGINVVHMLLHFAVHGTMTDDSLLEEKINEALFAPCYNVSLLMKPGTIGSFQGIETLEAIPGVLAVVKAHEEGETLPFEAKGELRQIALRVLGTTTSTDEFAATMLAIQENASIASPQGEELALRGLTASDCEAHLYHVCTKRRNL